MIHILKRIGLICAVIIAIAVALYSIVYTIPTRHAVSLDGVKYQLGMQNSGFLEPVSIRLSGVMKRSLTGTKTFIGTLDIDDVAIPVPGTAQEIEINFNENGLGQIQYTYLSDGRFNFFNFGDLFLDDDLRQLTILVADDDETTDGNWNSGDGYMMSAPAGSREEALEISNRLMKDFLAGVHPLK